MSVSDEIIFIKHLYSEYVLGMNVCTQFSGQCCEVKVLCKYLLDKWMKKIKVAKNTYIGN